MIDSHATTISTFDEDLTAQRPRNKGQIHPNARERTRERSGASVLRHSRGAGLRHRRRVRFCPAASRMSTRSLLPAADSYDIPPTPGSRLTEPTSLNGL